MMAGGDELTDNFRHYVDQFEEAQRVTCGGRKESEKARDYVDGRQFTAEEEALLKKRRQPITPENLIRPKIESLCGLELQGRTDPKAYPRTPVHEPDADAATDALRYVAQAQDFNIKKSRVFENMLVEGFGGVEVSVRQLRDGSVDPYLVHIEWHRLYYDPHSSRADFEDATYKGYTTWMDEEEALRHTKPGGKWAGKEDVIQGTKSSPFSTSTTDHADRPAWAAWFDAKRRRVRINTHYHLVDGVWNVCVFTLAGSLEDTKPVPFLDEQGKPECPLVMESAYIDRDNDRYGIVRDMIPLQDGVNKRHGKFLHMISSTKVRVSRTAGADAEAIRKEMQRPDGVIVAEQGEFEEIGNLGKESAQFQLMQDMRATLKANVGPNAYLSGKLGTDQSGKAISLQQQAGMTEMARLLDNLRHFTLRVYRQCWNRIRQYWDAPRWIRVTDNSDSAARFVAINQPPQMTPDQAIAGAMKVRDALHAGMIDVPTAMKYAADLEGMARTKNPVAELDVDIEIDEVADTPTLQIEQFQQLTQLLGTGIMPASPQLLRLIIEASSLRDKPKLLEIVDNMEKQQAAAASAAPNAGQPNQAQGLDLQKTAADIANTQANSEKTAAQIDLIRAQARTEQAKAFAAGMQVNAIAGMGRTPGLAA
jgi:hypothetical protein